MTKGQTSAYEQESSHYRVTLDELSGLSCEDAPRKIEIGFGMGQALYEWASSQPQDQFLGIELYQPGVGSLVRQLTDGKVQNVKICEQPAQLVLAALAENSVDEVRILFPDPWPKKRHHARRLIQTDFLTLLFRVLKAGGRVVIATDWTPYADWIRECFADFDKFSCTAERLRSASEDSSSRDGARPHTKFEQRGERLGHDIHDFVFLKPEV